MLSGNKIEKWITCFWSELKHLFTYSPIHFHLLAESLSILFLFILYKKKVNR
jgi:hypothetical protein